ncbi:putative cytochrome P450 2F2-like [Scophthalmus maximus]|uniref:Putative cytochrome P450 2F2-like n=1 Tax=Scophthalmus maximus TaxID=52904 RepID=A0A2U9BX98_SCOMX|nr:putative cytochrome P450 2F2-like [Scophthalmus maximus]
MFVSVALFFASALLFLLLFQNRRAKDFPPGPRAIPVFGNLLQLNLESPLADMEKLAKRYGNVYSLFIGARPMVVINGVQALKESLGRQRCFLLGETKKPNGQSCRSTHAPGVVLADFGPCWRDHRRFGLMILRNFGLGKRSMEQRILGEIHTVIKVLDESVGKAMDPHLLFHNAASNVICQVLFAKQFDYDDEFMTFFVSLFHETSKIINGRWGMIYDSIPMVRSLPLPFQKAFRMFKAAHERRLQMLAESKQTRVPGKPRHFIDCYLDELDKACASLTVNRRDEDSTFSEDQLCALILDLHFAGTDTSANTLLSAFLYLTNYPRTQERCQREIDTVLDGKDQVSFEDRHKMPYVQAVIHEIQRKANTVPLSVFHCTTEDTELMGYSIPKGTIIIPNLCSAMVEEGQWKSHHEFHPENFLNDQGEFVKPEAFMPFSIGPRTCLGEGLARMELFLILVTLLRKFRFIWPEDAGEPDFVPVFGTTQTPKPYRMKVQLRGADMKNPNQTSSSNCD